jgi:hypothetical protein
MWKFAFRNFSQSPCDCLEKNAMLIFWEMDLWLLKILQIKEVTAGDFLS